MSDELKPCPILDGIGLTATYHAIRARGCSCPNRVQSPAAKRTIDVPGPSDAERATWPDATRDYVDALEIDNAAHGYALSVVRQHFGLPEGTDYSALCDERDKLVSEIDRLRAHSPAVKALVGQTRRCAGILESCGYTWSASDLRAASAAVEREGGGEA